MSQLKVLSLSLSRATSYKWKKNDKKRLLYVPVSLILTPGKLMEQLALDAISK